ncbi:MAG TPA: hypothetical protein VI756_07085 [Blastocatellia bacterium]
MRKSRLVTTCGLAVFLICAAACQFSVSTANLSGLKISKDKDGSQETNTFGANDTVYAVATVSNSPDKVKVKGQLSVVDVPGEKAGPIPGLEKDLDLPGSGTATFTFSPPETGWPKGKYKMDVVMLNENGEQKGEKTADFEVS